MIEATFAMQYNIRLRNEPEMPWSEFCSLLKGIMPETPLGQMVSIRSEDDKEILKNFTKEQHSIRNSWRSKNNKVKDMTEEEKKKAVRDLQDMFAKMFS